MEKTYIGERITKFRQQKEEDEGRTISEYRMSLELGHAKGYIQSITSGRSNPSINELFSICEYLKITPSQFFSSEEKYPHKINQILDYLIELEPTDLEIVLTMVKRIHDLY